MNILHPWASVICEWCKGKVVQYRLIVPEHDDSIWHDYKGNRLEPFDGVTFEWRVKPDAIVVRYIRVLSKNSKTGKYYIHNCTTEGMLRFFIKSPAFHKVLGDWIEEEITL